jgi:hypothetical protein
VMADVEPACGVNWSRTRAGVIQSRPVTSNNARPSTAALGGDATFSRFEGYVS